MALRASSLAAVTIFVWSTRLKPISQARCRTACRTMTICSEVVSGSKSAEADAILASSYVDRHRQQVHALLDGQRGAYAGKGYAQLDESNGNGRAHTDDDCFCVQHTRHRGYVAQHTSYERVDNLERRDVDQHTPCAGIGNACRQIVLQLQSQPIVHIHLDRHEEKGPHFKDGNALHLSLIRLRRG